MVVKNVRTWVTGVRQKVLGPRGPTEPEKCILPILAATLEYNCNQTVTTSITTR